MSKLLCLLLSITSVFISVPARVGELQYAIVVEQEAVEYEEYESWGINLETELLLYIDQTSEKYEVPVELSLAIIQTESNFDVNAVSVTNDYGLMQLNEIHSENFTNRYGNSNMLEPYQNIDYGISMLSGYLKKFEDINAAVMSYNLGEYGYYKKISNNIYTTSYSQTVLNRMDEWREITNNE